MYKFTEKSKKHSFYLGDGVIVAMASSPAGPSFQKEVVHRVPAAKTKGYRINLTVRTTSQVIRDPMTIPGPNHLISDTSLVLVLDNVFSIDELAKIKGELHQTILDHGVADVTKLFGKTFDNKGRRVLELANQPGFQYQYAGKTVTGIAFTPILRNVVMPRFAELFGVPVSDLWAHLVYYPTGDCKLDWHDDGEDGINPHFIASVTFLEDPVGGIRPFDVRLKSAFLKSTKKARLQ